MICTVMPDIPEMRTRTMRKPRPSSKGSAMPATRAASPVSGMRRGSDRSLTIVGAIMRFDNLFG